MNLYILKPISQLKQIIDNERSNYGMITAKLIKKYDKYIGIEIYFPNCDYGEEDKKFIFYFAFKVFCFSENISNDLNFKHYLDSDEQTKILNNTPK